MFFLFTILDKHSASVYSFHDHSGYQGKVAAELIELYKCTVFHNGQSDYANNIHPAENRTLQCVSKPKGLSKTINRFA